jgi:hypothetical protein
MTQVTLAEAQQRLPSLLSAAEAGETVTIQRDHPIERKGENSDPGPRQRALVVTYHPKVLESN